MLIRTLTYQCTYTSLNKHLGVFTALEVYLRASDVRREAPATHLQHQAHFLHHVMSKDVCPSFSTDLGNPLNPLIFNSLFKRKVEECRRSGGTVGMQVCRERQEANVQAVQVQETHPSPGKAQER